jgi:hypothetical protein
MRVLLRLSVMAVVTLGSLLVSASHAWAQG